MEGTTVRTKSMGASLKFPASAASCFTARESRGLAGFFLPYFLFPHLIVICSLATPNESPTTIAAGLSAGFFRNGSDRVRKFQEHSTPLSVN